MSSKTSSRRSRGRPKLPGKAKFLRLRDSVFRLWRERKHQLGFENSTDSCFAEILLHRCPADVDTRDADLQMREEEDTIDESLSLNSNTEVPLMSTPKRSRPLAPKSEDDRAACRSRSESDKNSRNSLVDITGVSGTSTLTLQNKSRLCHSSRSWLFQRPFSTENPYSVVDVKSFDDSDVSSDDLEEVLDLNIGEQHPGLEKTMRTMLEDLNCSDVASESDSDECAAIIDSVECDQELGDASVSMDISIEDDEKTLTMIDPFYGQKCDETVHGKNVDTDELVTSESENITAHIFSTNQQSERVENTTSSTTAEDNKVQILKELSESFKELTNVKKLEHFSALYSRARAIVSVDKLLELNGDKCMAVLDGTICGTKLAYSVSSCGSRLELTLNCCKGHTKKWVSSEVLCVKSNNNIYLNDSLQAAAILTSGNNYSKISLLAKALNLNLVGPSTFLRFQKHCAAPVVRNVWSKMNQIVINILKKYDKLCMCGDGRNDSPGHSAKNCVYILMEHATKVVVDFEILDSRETGGNSVAMEREGLRRLLERLSKTLPFSELVTDASTTIMKLVRETKEKFPVFMELFHSLDIWHKAKKLHKCLHQAARLKGCEKLKDWVEDIVNHFWFCCQICNGNVEELKSAWFGVLHHVCGEHSWAEGACKHDLEAVERSSKTVLEKSSKAMEALRKIVLDKKWLNHFSFYVKFRHTSDLESFNSMLTKYAPKRMAFEYPYFIVRIMLAAIDNNMHLFRGNKSSADGSERGHRKFSKRTRRYHSEPIKEEKEYSYFPYIMSRMLKERSEFQGSISQQTDDNVFDPKQIAPTLGMKEPPPTKELMKGPSRFFKDLEN